MKLTHYLSFVALVMLSSYSCETDPGETDPVEVDLCENKFCTNRGVCIEGTCICEEGFEGEDCECMISSTSSFIGCWSANDWRCNGNRSQDTSRYRIEKYENSDSLQFIFINENGLPSSGRIAIQIGDTLNIPFQEVSGTTNEGELILLSENSIRLEIVIDNGIGVLNCDATLFRE